MERKYIYEVSFVGNEIKCELYKNKREQIDEWEIPLRTEKNGLYIISDIAETVQRNIAENWISELEVAELRLSLPKEDQINLRTLRFLRPGWTATEIEHELREETGLRITTFP